MIKIKTFGIIAEKVGSQEIKLDLMKDTDSLRAILMDTYPELSNLKFTIAVDKTQVNDNVVLEEWNEVALLPPFSGG